MGAERWLISRILIPELLYSLAASPAALKTGSGKQAGPALKL